MPWRYQPVWVEDDQGDRTYTLVEAYFDQGGSFLSWTDGDSCPCGETVEDLTADLNRMVVDAICWEPVKRNELRPGMKFEPRVSMDDRRAVADFVDANAAAMKRQPKPARN